MTETHDLSRFLKFCPDIPTNRKTLIAGSAIYGDKPDRRQPYETVVGVDMQEGEGVDVVVDMSDYLETTIALRDAGYLFPGDRFGLIECLSMLEHCRQPWRVASTIENLLEPGGILLLSAPFVWTEHGYPDDYFRYTKSGIKSLFPNIQWQSLEYFGLGNMTKKPIRLDFEGWPYLGRTEVFGYGIRK